MRTLPHRILSKRGKTPPCCESGTRVTLRCSAREKILNLSQWIHLRFCPAPKITDQPYLHSLAMGRFCLTCLTAGILASSIVLRGARAQSADAAKQAVPAVAAEEQQLEQPVRTTPTPLPTVAPEDVRKAYMNCLFEVDKAEQSASLNRRARQAEAMNQLTFCENRKKDCSLRKDGADCRVFVEEFAAN